MRFLSSGSGDQAFSDLKAAVSSGLVLREGHTVPWPGGLVLRSSTGQAGIRSGQEQVSGSHPGLIQDLVVGSGRFCPLPLHLSFLSCKGGVMIAFIQQRCGEEEMEVLTTEPGISWASINIW